MSKEPSITTDADLLPSAVPFWRDPDKRAIVFQVVALLLVIVKLGVLATVEVHYGIYMYAGAGLLIMVTTTIIISIAKKELAIAS